LVELEQVFEGRSVSATPCRVTPLLSALVHFEPLAHRRKYLESVCFDLWGLSRDYVSFVTWCVCVCVCVCVCAVCVCVCVCVRTIMNVSCRECILMSRGYVSLVTWRARQEPNAARCRSRQGCMACVGRMHRRAWMVGVGARDTHMRAEKVLETV
jgi:hypothetical protein